MCQSSHLAMCRSVEPLSLQLSTRFSFTSMIICSNLLLIISPVDAQWFPRGKTEKKDWQRASDLATKVIRQSNRKRQQYPSKHFSSRYEIAKGTANGLQFLHSDHVWKSMGEKKSKALIHGDIKSANILLDKNLLPKIGDFGIAREVDGEMDKSKYTHLSSIHGTKWYLPEDFLRTKTLTVTVDTYSFGVVLFDMVTGRSPHVKVGKPLETQNQSNSTSISQR